jgi:hypothetical protein
LAQIDELEVGRRFAVPLEALQMLQQGIQMVIDGRREGKQIQRNFEVEFPNSHSFNQM